tara:strand:+ start:200 stop:445 length:246 start_codon:yes stop_codon:yes gene_type:complete
MAGFDTHLLLLTMEECGELVRACSKAYRHDFDEKTRRNLSEEIADVEVMINLLKETGIADEEIIRNKKKAKYEQYYGKDNT